MKRYFLSLAILSFFIVFPIAPSFAAPKKSELTDKKFMNLYNSALQRYLSGQVDVAIGAAQNILRKWPQSPRTLALLGWCYKKKKLYPRAIDYFNRASKFFDDKTEFFEKAQMLYNIAFAYELLKQNLAAVASWKVYINFASNYPQEAQGVAFAQSRVQALTSVKRK